MSTKIQTKEHPIIFNSEMVRAILEGRKTQTRRVIKPQPSPKRVCKTHDPKQMLRTTDFDLVKLKDNTLAEPNSPAHIQECLYGKVGDKLWARETWWDLGFWSKEGKWHGRTHHHIIAPKYVADGKPEGLIAESKRPSLQCKWWKRPSIFMPKWAARIWLEITNIRVERVQDISEQDAEAEGTSKMHLDNLGQTWRTYKRGFESLWDSINNKRGFSWDSNPFVWVIEFKVLEK